MKTTKMVVILVLALGLTGEVANADFIFGSPTNLGSAVNSEADDESPSISADGLVLVFFSTRPGGYGELDLWMTTRATTSEPWGESVNMGPLVNSPDADWCPSISSDGYTLYFGSRRAGGIGNSDIWMSTRATREDDWSEPVNLGSNVNTAENDGTPFISHDGLELYFSSVNRPGGRGANDIWISTRETKDSEWGPAINPGLPVNTPNMESWPMLSSDGLLLFFSSGLMGSARPGGLGGSDIWMARRKSRDSEWTEPVNLGAPVNSSISEWAPSISADGSTLYFSAGGFGAGDLYEVSIEPVVDLNADGIVDSADMCIMVDNWGENYSLCDIGPMPWGDGIVDVQDLIVLAGYLSPAFAAHWKLDETEGILAHDSAGENDAYVIGGPLWQSTSGMVDGALQFDGVDDYLVTGTVLDPAAERPFSVLAWIKGGAPGQVVLSQMGGANWLCTDSLEGNLMTELKGTGQNATELLSQTIITDGDWHRIGLVWDRAYRTLYVDDVEVAKDAQEGLEPATGGLYIGTGKAMESGTHWSGLIDDVRIYNRAVSP